jgi:hypothetical protein
MQPINERIKELEFKDTKVRVTNVDSQGSDSNIVIQVIGEISNNNNAHRRFVQTFVLAAQTNGYFVLNDIFRYLADDSVEDEEAAAIETSAGIQEPAPTAEVETETPATHEVATSEQDLVEVDNKLNETVEAEEITEPAPPAAVNGTPVQANAQVVEAEDAPAAVVSAEEVSSKEPDASVTEEPVQEEKPKDPTPTPVAAPIKPSPAPAATPAVPSKPAAPRTWASLAASANKSITPAVPAPATPQTTTQSKSAPAPTQQPAAPAAQVSTPVREPSPANSQGDASGWQSVTGHKKEQSRAQNQAPTGESEPKRAYIKNVYSQVDEQALKNALSSHGEITYLDISRQKVSFKSQIGNDEANTLSELRFRGFQDSHRFPKCRESEPPQRQWD